MGLRILTGVLIPRQTSGNATIHFSPHQVTGDADGVDLDEWGDGGDFTQPPGRTVCLRHFTIQDRNRVFDNSARIEIEQCQIKDAPPTTEQMVVRWTATKGAEIKGISYLIVGEA